MATKTDNTESDNINPSARDYEDSFNKSLSTPNTPTDLAAQDQRDAAMRNSNTSSASVANAEKQAVGDTAVGKAAIAASAGVNPVVGGAIKVLAKIKTKKGAAGSIVAGLIILLLVGGSILTGTLAPIAFFTNVIDDLNDQVAALDIRNDKMMRVKLSSAEQDKALKGCTKLSIRCKYRTLSDTQVKSFERQGIKVNSSKTVFGRVFPESYTYEGRNLSATEFADLIRNDAKARLKFRSAINMKVLSVSDGKFQRAMDRLGISKKKPELSGTDEERTKQLANPDRFGIPEGSKLVPATNEDGSPRLGPDGKPLYMIEGDTRVPTPTYTEAQKATFEAMRVPKSISRLSSQAIKSLNILGWYDMACSFKNLVGTAAVGAKLARYMSLAQYAMPIAALAYAWKANDITDKEFQTLAEFFTDTDNRKMITDIEASLKASGVSSGGGIGDITTIVEKPNPEFGTNVMDSDLYKLSAYGDVPSSSASSSQYSLGMGAVSVLSAVGASASVMENVLNIGSGNKGCQLAQNWLVRGAGFIVGIVAGVFSGGTTIGINVGVMAAISGGFILVETILNNILTGSVVPDGIEGLPSEKAAATWTGMAAIMGESSRTRGMVPANKKGLAGYLAHQNQSKSEYLAIEKQSISPFDLSSPHSTISQVALAVNNYNPKSLTSIATLVPSLLSTSAQKVVLGGNVSALDMQRFEKCDDPEYKEMDISADVQCNVRYIMYEEDLAQDPYEIVEWMEANKYIEVDSTTGLPPGYIPPSPQESSNLAQSLLDGFTSSFYDDRASYYTTESGDYAKYLDYCVYRALPWGNTFEESGALGSAEEGWKTGSYCKLEANESALGAKVAKFRMFTFDMGTIDVAETPSEVYSDTANSTSPVDTTTPDLPTGTWVWPTTVHTITQPWGNWNYSRNGAHKGIDIGVGAGTVVRAAHNGTVVNSGVTYDSPACGRMLTIKVEGSNPAIYMNYQHLAPDGPMPSGPIRAGQVVGTVVATNRINRGYTCSSGAHLHFQIQNTDSFIVGYSSPLSLTQNPLNYLPK